MSNQRQQKNNPDQSLIYQIRVKGHLGRQWRDWFGNATITLEEDGDTLLTCPVVDQAALYGLLKKIRDLGMPLLSVNRIKTMFKKEKKDDNRKELTTHEEIHLHRPTIK
jgi:hypothetical protein